MQASSLVQMKDAQGKMIMTALLDLFFFFTKTNGEFFPLKIHMSLVVGPLMKLGLDLVIQPRPFIRPSMPVFRNNRALEFFAILHRLFS